MRRALTYAFLRLYAFNLGRSWRNSSDLACDDAIMQLGMVLAVPVGLVLAAIGAIIPGAGASIKSKHPVFILIAVLLVLPLMYWLGGKFDGYRKTPEAADLYRSRAERMKSLLGFVLFPIFFLACVGSLFYLLRK